MFTESRKALIGFILFVRPPVRATPTGRLFVKFVIELEKSIEKISDLVNIRQNIGKFTWKPKCFAAGSIIWAYREMTSGC